MKFPFRVVSLGLPSLFLWLSCDVLLLCHCSMQLRGFSQECSSNSFWREGADPVRWWLLLLVVTQTVQILQMSSDSAGISFQILAGVLLLIGSLMWLVRLSRPYLYVSSRFL